MKPSASEAGSSDGACPSTIIPPISTTPWMKFEPDIKGVCRMTGTRAITS